MITLRKRLLETLENLKEDDGNPSMIQASGWDMDNDQIAEEWRDIARVKSLLSQAAVTLTDILERNPGNKKLEELWNKLDSYIDDLEYEQFGRRHQTQDLEYLSNKDSDNTEYDK